MLDFNSIERDVMTSRVWTPGVTPDHPPGTEIDHMNKKLLLIGWDAADWKVIDELMAEGKMPTLKRMVEEGTSGNLRTLQPPLSPMLWTSIATGKHNDALGRRRRAHLDAGHHGL